MCEEIVFYIEKNIFICKKNRKSMRTNILFTVLISILIFSCGPSEAERQAIEQETLRKVELKNKFENKLKEVRKKLDETQENIITTNAELEVAQSTMNDIKGFQLLRSKSEKENQIKKQSIYISRLKENIKTLESNTIIYKNLITELEVQLLNY